MITRALALATILVSTSALADGFLPNFSQGEWKRTVVSSRSDEKTTVSVDKSEYLGIGELQNIGGDNFVAKNAVTENQNSFDAFGRLVGNTLTLQVFTPTYQGTRILTRLSPTVFSIVFIHADARGQVYDVTTYSLEKVR
jgi:hypothetical protein